MKETVSHAKATTNLKQYNKGTQRKTNGKLLTLRRLNVKGNYSSASHLPITGSSEQVPCDLDEQEYSLIKHRRSKWPNEDAGVAEVVVFLNLKSINS